MSVQSEDVRTQTRTASAVHASAGGNGALHHSTRVLVLLALAGLVTALFPPEQRTRLASYAVDQVVEEDILAQVSFSIPKTPAELERERQAVRAAVPPTFNYRPAAVDSMVVRLERFFDDVSGALGSEDSAAVARMLDERSIQATAAQMEVLRDPSALESLRATAVEASRELLPSGVADPAELLGVATAVVTVRPRDGSEYSVDRGDLLTTTTFVSEAVRRLPPDGPLALQELLRLILIQHLEYSFELNLTATEMDRDAAARAVPSTKGDVAQNQAIVRQYGRIGPAELEMIAAHNAQLEAMGLLEEGRWDVRAFLGSAFMNLLLLAILGLLVFFFCREVYANIRWTVLIASLAAVYFAVAAVLAGNQLPSQLLPIAFVALTVAVLWDGRLALVIVAVLAVTTGVQLPFRSLDVVATVLVGGGAAALSVRAVRRRAQTWLFIAIISAAYAGMLLAIALRGGWEASALALNIVATTSNATLSAILAMGFVPVFELFTGITTDQTLLEWADPNRSLLKRLSMEAPGTYAHTINVANLAESAAAAIGAHGLLCRVGLYYHDVGKMLKPHYFVENQPQGRNPHDHLKPDVSAAIVREHVVEGLRLAREAKVPEVVAAFVPEHHGTQRISYFWEKAKAEYGEDQLDPADYTYPGPKPQSRETTIAMLADSVESATRVLQDPTPERIRGLIENIVDAKIADGQLDEAPVTLQEVRQIKEQFVKVLSGIYHHRIDYPSTRHLTEAPGTGDESSRRRRREDRLQKDARAPATEPRTS